MTIDRPTRLLLLETSGRTGFVALAIAGQIVGQRRLEESRRQARDLAPFVSALLTEAGIAPRELTGVVVGLGPGSYTGLRVGLISAKVLAYTTGCVLLGIPTFEVIAARAPVGRVEVLADAQKDRVYHQSFDAGRPLGAVRIVAWDDWAKTCPAGAIATGPGARKFPERTPADVVVQSPELCEPNDETLLRLGLARLDRGERDDVHALEPLYLRPSSAEEQWDSRRTTPQS